MMLDKINKEIAERERSILAAALDDYQHAILSTDTSPADFADSMRAKLWEWARHQAEEGEVHDAALARINLHIPPNFVSEIEKHWIPPSSIQAVTEQLRALHRVKRWVMLLHDASKKIADSRQVDEILGEIHAAQSAEEMTGSLRTNEVVLTAAYEQTKEVQEGRRLGFLSTGHIRLNQHAPVPGEVVVIGAESSMGKSLLASTIAEFMTSMPNPIPTLFDSLEMPDEEISIRKFSHAARISSGAFRNPGALQAEHHDSIGTYIDGHKKNPLLWQRIDSPTKLVSVVARLSRQVGLKAVFIDYLQNMNLGAGERYDLKIADAMRAFYSTAKRYGVTFFVLSQLRKPPPGASDQREPKLADLKESGAIRQIADHVWLLFRPGYTDTKEEDNRIMVKIAKNRNGPTGDEIRLSFKNGELTDWR